MRPAWKTGKLNAVDITKMRRTMSNQQIADFYGVTKMAYFKWCYRHNVITSRVTDWELAEGIGTMTVKELAIEYNVQPALVYRRLAKMGICTKQDGQKGGSACLNN